jgi:hypothetical protein
MKTFFYKLTIFVLSIALFSCSARLDGSLAADGSAVLSVRMSLEPAITALIQRLAVAGGQSGQGGQIIDGPSIAASMSEAPGISSASFRNTSLSAIEGQVRISDVGSFLTITEGASLEGDRFIIFEKDNRLQINLNSKNGPMIIKMLSEEINDYLNALMAPIATGEEMTKAEYLENITSFYNRNISNEIAASRIRVSIDFPGTITNVRGGTFLARRANFDIPLIDLLVLETPLVFVVEWR